MAEAEISSAKVVLLAVQFATISDISSLRSLLSLHRKTLRHELLLRILLSHLPESVSPSEYIPLLQDLSTSDPGEVSEATFDSSALGDLSESNAKKKVRNLHLLPLAWPNSAPDVPPEPLIQFLIHRSIRIDQVTGLIDQLPELLQPFLHISSYLRTWFISTILPLQRFTCDHYHDKNIGITISKFETLDTRAGVALLLSGNLEDQQDNEAKQANIGRDLKSLVGPWMYGDTHAKRRKLHTESSVDLQFVESLNESPIIDSKYAGWEEVFSWLVAQAEFSGRVAVEAVEQWDGPGDVDLGRYDDGTEWLDEDAQIYLEKRYARVALAIAYTIPIKSQGDLEGIQRILVRIITLLDEDRIPTLQAAGALLSPVSGISGLLNPKTNTHLKNNLLSDSNIATTPNNQSIKFLHALLVSAFIFAKSGCQLSLKDLGEMVLLQDKADQKIRLNTLMMALYAGSIKTDDKIWTKRRNEIHWLRTWGAEILDDDASDEYGKGVLGQLSKEFVDTQFLTCLLRSQRYVPARSIYEMMSIPPLGPKEMEETVMTQALHAYDNATNPNKTRGGLQECLRILQVFPHILAGSQQLKQLVRLVDLTHNIGTYRLVLKQGEPFKPVNLRVHKDPISIIGRILDQNTGSYTDIADFVNMGHDIVNAGLEDSPGAVHTILEGEALTAHIRTAEQRIVSMCVDAALIEDDFETAYSFISTRLKSVAGLAQSESSDSLLVKKMEPSSASSLDDWSWRAALQAGKYRKTSRTVKATHSSGTTVGNPEIRHLEQRMECFSQALRLAPKGTLVEILNQWRRCEEELESLYKQEAEQEDAWDAQGDDQLMPGGFESPILKRNTTTSASRPVEEAPMSLFDLSRASVARAQSGLATLSLLRGNNSTQHSRPESRQSNEISRVSTPDSAGLKAPLRKRDQVKNLAVGGLASGVGWLIGAPAAAGPKGIEDDEED